MVSAQNLSQVLSSPALSAFMATEITGTCMTCWSSDWSRSQLRKRCPLPWTHCTERVEQRDITKQSHPRSLGWGKELPLVTPRDIMVLTSTFPLQSLLEDNKPLEETEKGKSYKNLWSSVEGRASQQQHSHRAWKVVRLRYINPSWDLSPCHVPSASNTWDFLLCEQTKGSKTPQNGHITFRLVEPWSGMFLFLFHSTVFHVKWDKPLFQRRKSRATSSFSSPSLPKLSAEPGFLSAYAIH